MEISVALPPIAQKLGGAGFNRARLDAFIATLSEEEAVALATDPDLWRLPYQELPSGDWTRWIMRCGRGTGKTYTGGDRTNAVARDRKKIRTGEIGIIGRTATDARMTMIEGPSGILATAPPDFRPRWEPGNGILKWPNGVRGRVFSADKPEQIRGLNAAWIWGDEPAYWPDLYTTWMESIEPALRRGWARAMLTTTPKRKSKDLKMIEDLPGSVVTRAHTLQNPYLEPEVRARFLELYQGTRSGRQELGGDHLLENELALWKMSEIEASRATEAPPLRRVVVAIDPAVTANENSDETGIIVVGERDGHGYVLADNSGIYTPNGWARRSVASFYRWDADRIVPEVNNGGDMVVDTIRAVDGKVPVKPVRASRGKVIRAEPVAALYERGLIHHVGHFPELEEQLVEWDPSSSKSPDRLDALVWALTELFFPDQRPVGPLTAYL